MGRKVTPRLGPTEFRLCHKPMHFRRIAIELDEIYELFEQILLDLARKRGNGVLSIAERASAVTSSATLSIQLRAVLADWRERDRVIK